MDSLIAKKSLGQYFLRSKNALRQILRAASLVPGDLVLEIGPGEGALTEALLSSGARVVAVETDARAIVLLSARFRDEIADGRLRLIEGDIRSEETQKTLFYLPHLGAHTYKLVANIPYYITGYLFRLFLEQLRQPTLIIFLIQKEVADQIIARDSKEGMLSLSIKAFGTPRYVATVKREAFSPPPKVDSAIIAIEDIDRKHFSVLKTEEYFRVLRAGLGSKRKMLLGNLAGSIDVPKQELQNMFAKLGVSPSIRGEDLPVNDWLSLAGMLRRQKDKLA